MGGCGPHSAHRQPGSAQCERVSASATATHTCHSASPSLRYVTGGWAGSCDRPVLVMPGHAIFSLLYHARVCALQGGADAAATPCERGTLWPAGTLCGPSRVRG